MVITRKKIIILLNVFCIFAVFVYGQETIYLQINDNNVRLREEAGLNGKIIRQLAKNEIVEYINDFYDGSEFKWVNVKTTKETGWIYGEFLEYTTKNRLIINRIEDVGIIVSKGVLLSGMPEKNIISLLGSPSRISNTDDSHENSYYYGVDDDIRIYSYKYNGRINHITIKSSKYELACGIKIGMNINDIQTPYDRRRETENYVSYSYQVRNRFRHNDYDSFLILHTDLNGIINEIITGFPGP